MEWISVKDRMPPETREEYRCGYSDRVLVFNKYGRILISVALYPRNGVKPFVSDDATHWMPLPAPPSNA